MVEIKKKAVIIGYGSIGSRYARLLKNFGFEVGCVDIKKKRQIRANKFKFFNSIEDCVISNPEIIIISTPPKAHLPCLLQAIKSKAKILIEKPLAANEEDVIQILKIAKKNKKIFSVANMRYHPGFKIIKKNFNRLGKIYFAVSNFSHKLSQMRQSSIKNIYASNKQEGGVILDCVHDIDLIYNLFGKIKFKNSTIASIGKEKIDSEDYANINLLAKKNIQISINLDFLSTWKTRGIKIIGEKGSIFWESQGKNPEVVSVKLFGRKGLINNYLNNFYLDKDYTYKEMLTDFIHSKKNTQSVNDAFEVFKIASIARLKKYK